MKAAVVTDFNQAPQYREFETPVPAEGEVRINVLASSVNHLVKGKASGQHYSSQSQQLPFIPGVDGVGTLENGQKVYFIGSSSIYGPLAEQTVVERQRLIPIPQEADAVQVAAAMNPAMSSWMALKSRVGDIKGKRVMILGATGAAGKAAIEVSRYLGASEVIAVGRNKTKLDALSVDQHIWLGDESENLAKQVQANADVDVVLDYLWGSVAEQLLPLMMRSRKDAGVEITRLGHFLKRFSSSKSNKGKVTGLSGIKKSLLSLIVKPQKTITWVEIGSMAGADITLPAAVLRSVALKLVGSGIGSVAPTEFLKELPELAKLISAGHFIVETEAVPLNDVSEGWQRETDKRLVFTM